MIEQKRVGIRVGDIVEVEPGDRHIVFDIHPPKLAQIGTTEEGHDYIHPLSGRTIDQQMALRKTSESWPPPKMGEALVRGYEANGYRRPTEVERAQIHKDINERFDKGHMLHPGEHVNADTEQ